MAKTHNDGPKSLAVRSGTGKERRPLSFASVF